MNPNSRIFKALVGLVEELFPDLELPLYQKRHFYKGLSDSNTGRYNYAKISYLSSKDGEILFNEFSRNHPHENVAWEVNDKLEKIFFMIGEELFVSFIKEFFGIDLTDKRGKEYDWVFR